MTVSKHWCNLKIEADTNKHEDLNLAFANHREEEEIYPLTTIEIEETQCKDQELKAHFKKNTRTPKEDMHFQLIEDTKVLCKNHKQLILASLRHWVVSWYHHCLQHPWPLTFQRDNEILDVLERYAQFHPEIHQILQILPNK
jgi:hypothetical protein